jgi:hypothetical protein
MRNVPRRVLLALPGVMAWALAACGGGGGGAGTTGPGVTPALSEVANHAPVLEPIADAANSATTLETRIHPLASDPDGDGLAFLVGTDDPAVASASIDAESGDIVLEPRASGLTNVTVSVTDGELSATTAFRFTVGDVTRTTPVNAASGEAIVLVNATDADADFVLTHNGFRTYQSSAEMVAEVDAMIPRQAGEPFEQRLWRFVRDNTWHDVPLGPANWLSNPAVLVNSLGWGFCHNVAGTYAELARVAGYESRIWGLNGHVVPEVRIEGRWQLYDPDLAVYYHDAAGGIAGVEQLVADPSLITAPVAPLLPADAWPYNAEVADIYATDDNNFIDVAGFKATAEVLTGRVVLPAHARLTYQGRWTEAPVTDVTDPATTITEYEQANLTLAAGWTGALNLPWMLWDVTGDGDVRIGGITYAAGSTALRARLRGDTQAPASIEVTRSDDPLRLVFLVNPLRYEVRAANVVQLTGREVWRVEAGVESLPEANRPGAPFPAARRKPAP